MNKITLLAGIAIGAVLTAGVAQLQAQAPAPGAATTRNAFFVITEQTITDQAKYEKDFQQQAARPSKMPVAVSSCGRPKSFRSTGDPPKRVVVLGFESLDEVKKWQGGEYAKRIPVRDQIGKWRSFVVPTCRKSAGREARPDQVPVSWIAKSGAGDSRTDGPVRRFIRVAKRRSPSALSLRSRRRARQRLAWEEERSPTRASAAAAVTAQAVAAARFPCPRATCRSRAWPLPRHLHRCRLLEISNRTAILNRQSTQRKFILR